MAERTLTGFWGELRAPFLAQAAAAREASGRLNNRAEGPKIGMKLELLLVYAQICVQKGHSKRQFEFE